MFLKPLMKMTDIPEASRTIKVSYFDSKKKGTVSEIIKLQTSDAFACDKDLQESVFKLGK